MKTATYYKGFLQFDICPVSNQSMETLFAVSPDGRIFASQYQLHGDSFSSSRWTEVDAIPAGLEFIGRYPRPKNTPQEC